MIREDKPKCNNPCRIFVHEILKTEILKLNPNIQMLFIFIFSFIVLPIANLSVKLYAQEHKIKFDKITIENGLSQNSIFCIVQDQKGFMWFGTEDGLNKFDGYNFTVYKNDILDSNSLSNSYVLSIIEDRNNNLWVGTDGGGLNKYIKGTDSFVHFKHDVLDPNSLSSDKVHIVFEDHLGELWIGTEGGGLNRFNPQPDGNESLKFIHYKHDPNDPNSISNNQVLSICEDNFGNLWVGTNGGGLNKFDRESETFLHYKQDTTNPFSINNNRINSIYGSQSGILWIGTETGGLNRLDLHQNLTENSRFVHYPNNPNDPNSISHNRIYSIYEDRKGLLWIGTEGGGINRVDLREIKNEKVRFTHFKTEVNNPNSLNINRIYSIFEDRSGVLWFGTIGGGINKFDRERKKISHYKENPNDVNSLSHNSIWSICEDDSGTFWIGSLGGLTRFEFLKNRFINYSSEPGKKTSLTHNYVRAICKDKSGMLWIGTDGGGISKIDPKQSENESKFINYKKNPDDPTSLSHNKIRSIYKDNFGVLWIGTFGGGLNRVDSQKNLPGIEHFISYKNDPDDPDNIVPIITVHFGNNNESFLELPVIPK